jgi:hypothetical protein
VIDLRGTAKLVIVEQNGDVVVQPLAGLPIGASPRKPKYVYEYNRGGDGCERASRETWPPFGRSWRPALRE